ncbi:hypothetical protein B9Z55_014284 [Caenorhabditis nigoni]|uniref:RING-type domain-containing protein n=1 Tax=Caenorhabditis nigoni TaxID=1611254 RepID=A0A2G5U595_9PELO|nr:hypothetical protein B9Z55_014284 [Caenorhabditis nigoni]
MNAEQVQFLSYNLVCYECGELYKSVLKLEEEEDSHRIPCIGSCLHSICLLCLTSLNSSDCPICGEKDAFDEIIPNNKVLEQLERLKTSLGKDKVETILENLKIIEEKRCTSCESQSEELLFCKDCNQSKDMNFLKIKSPKEFILRPTSDRISLTCKKCSMGIEECQNHEFVSIDYVKNLRDMIQLDVILSAVHFHLSPSQYTVKYFLNVVTKWKLPHRSTCKVHGSPCSDYKHKILSQVRESEAICIELKKRELMFYRDQLACIVSCFEKMVEETEERQEKCELRNAYEKLKIILHKVKERADNCLAMKDIDRIDSKIDKRMLQLENDFKAKSFIRVEEVRGFFKYQALIKELKESKEAVRDAEGKLEKAGEELNEFKSEYLPTLQSLEVAEQRLDENSTSFTPEQLEIRRDYIEDYRDIISMDQDAESMTVDKLTIDVNAANLRKQYAELMILKYFPFPMKPKTPDYFALIQEFINSLQ